MKKAAALTLVSATLFAGCGSTSLMKQFDQKPAQTKALCKDYADMLDYGYTDEEMYKQIKDTGVSDKFTHKFFYAMIKWCYKNYDFPQGG